MEISQSTWIAIAFLLFFNLIGRKAFIILTENLDNRKTSIENELNHARQLREEAQTELNHSLKKKKDTMEEIKKILNEAKEASKKIKEDAKIQSAEIIKRNEAQAKNKINAMQIDSVNQIRKIGAKVAIESSEIYIKNNLSDETIKKTFKQNTNEIVDKL